MDGISAEKQNSKESISTWTQVYRLVRKSLDVNGIPPPDADRASIGHEEHDAGYKLIEVMQDFTKGIDNDLITTDGVQRLVCAALKDKSYFSYVESLTRCAGAVRALCFYTGYYPDLYTDEDFEDIRNSWGVVDSYLIYQKYVEDRVPKELRIRSGNGGSGGN